MRNPLGTPVDEVLDFGGGGWLPASAVVRARLSDEDIRAAGAAPGVASLIVLPVRQCDAVFRPPTSVPA
ncbi:hypothetical protein [Amycolatopsis sp. La24]|uniref:hypothetical protein n=1 Tax=Amycolatopsis sp. La24 TaxID=3028304 RepID=UPI0023B06248|nr:hypothetical protein [Amycolatopsis sp. La24]